MLKNKKKKKGFTLIELIIVIAIIAILAALAIPKFGSVKQSANLKSDVANAKTIATATSALLAEDTIDSNIGSIDLGSDTSDSIKIKNYLQTIPEPKGVEKGSFIVKIENGNVKVYIATSPDNTNDESNQVYPEPSEAGKKNNIWYGGTAAQ